MNRSPVPDPRMQAPGAATNGLVEVHLLAAPLLLWEEASQHTDELLREFAIIQIGAEQGADDVPVRLTALIDELRARYAGVSDEPTRRRQAAIAVGETATDLLYQVPPESAASCRALRGLLKDADEYCRHGDLLTLPSNPVQQRFRDWYLGEFVRQVAGEPPVAWPDAGPTGTSVRWGP